MTLDEAIKHSEEVVEEIEWCGKTYHHENKNYQKYTEEHRQLAEWLKELKQLKEQTCEWVPVSERLPKENGWYQCTVIVNVLPWTTELFYKNGKWLDNRRIDMINTYDIYGYGHAKDEHKLSYEELISEFDWTENVIAWMPLSEPYKTEKEK